MSSDLTPAEVAVALKASPPVIANITDLWPRVLVALHAVGIGSRMNQIGMAATIGVENPSFKPVEENLNYSAARMMAVWPKRFRQLDMAELYAHQPEKLANYVYAGRNGNGGEESGDGWRYRGRGPIQITGRRTYLECGHALGVDLLAVPEQLLDPVVSARSAAWFWGWKGCSGPAELGDWERVRRLVNGGLTHYAEFLGFIRGFGLAA